MSFLTLKLLRKKAPKRKKEWIEKFRAISDLLVSAYGVPSLGNMADPVQEIFYIVLSAKTTDALYRRTHELLTASWSSLAELANAPVQEIARCIMGGGLSNKKAQQIKGIAGRLIKDFGNDASTRLRSMDANEIFAYLTGLPGLGPKSAFCVMMYSLGFDVFPVDVNVSRIAIRLGAVRKGGKHYDYSQQLPGLVPEGRSKELHIGLVVHGRKTCLPRAPKCGSCILREYCKYGHCKSEKDKGHQTPTESD